MSQASSKGHFESDIATVQLLADGRRAKLLKDFTFVDAQNRSWVAPAGDTVDGASIPHLFWAVIGGPWEGKYRFASIVHDRYCNVHEGRSWQDVHRMFYEACLAAGTDELLAKIMYAAVYHFGPRWGDESRGAEELAELIAPERKRLAEEAETVESATMRSRSPQISTRAFPAPAAAPTQRQQAVMVLAPRRKAPGIQMNAASMPATLGKWDRIREFLRQHPDASPQDIERLP